MANRAVIYTIPLALLCALIAGSVIDIGTLALLAVYSVAGQLALWAVLATGLLPDNLRRF